jgi:hypothetical protein
MNRNTDLTKILTKAHERKWVALSPDYRKVVGYGDKLAALTARVGKKKVVYMKVPRTDTYHAFTCRQVIRHIR